ncbi:MAG: hypothetical protein KatS3mg015_2493 [Fimbriimonadales bacterium]|nr:MAG: hypothetical protein KatS3mg015_2493 [Fimbriimonadales bacterium]
MGYSISQETAERIDRYREEDRHCQGDARCYARARYVIAFNCGFDTFTRSDDGLDTMVLCGRHYADLAEGYRWHGYLFGNDHEARPLAVVEMARDEHGSHGRERALNEARVARAQEGA